MMQHINSITILVSHYFIGKQFHIMDSLKCNALLIKTEVGCKKRNSKIHMYVSIT